MGTLKLVRRLSMADYYLSVPVKGGMAGDSYAVGAGAGLNF